METDLQSDESSCLIKYILPRDGPIRIRKICNVVTHIYAAQGLEVSFRGVLQNLLLPRQLRHQPLYLVNFLLQFLESFGLVQFQPAVFSCGSSLWLRLKVHLSIGSGGIKRRSLSFRLLRLNNAQGAFQDLGNYTANPRVTMELQERREIPRLAGGEGGIRTHGRVSPTHAFQACSLNRSDTSPRRRALSSVTKSRRSGKQRCGAARAGNKFRGCLLQFRTPIRGSAIGSTPAFGAGYPGSSPGPGAKFLPVRPKDLSSRTITGFSSC